jgi:ETC complex I subunit conserved region
MNLSRSPCSAMATATTSVFPDDAHALIYWPAHSVTMSAPKRKHQWKLQFERRSPQRLEPLMGWTEGDDPLTLVELSFPSVEAAIAYARRQGLRYTVLGSPGPNPQIPPAAHPDTPSKLLSACPSSELQRFQKTHRPEQSLPKRPRRLVAYSSRNAVSDFVGCDGRIAA